MIPIARLEEPRILREKKAEWTADFQASSKKRPDSSKYAHREVTATLRSMSHEKCFYCETREGKLSVDHYIEVAERRDLAFEWTNLYLACGECQNKMPNTSIPAAKCVDPCETGVEPAAHIGFKHDRAVPLSERGDCTVRKYRLNERLLALQRARQLLLFTDVVEHLDKSQIREERKALSTEELAKLRSFAAPHEPFSLMFSTLLKSKGLL
ncbi:MAG: hypothetical protein R3B70_20065 [Polyangiaceae bacterium]